MRTEDVAQAYEKIEELILKEKFVEAAKEARKNAETMQKLALRLRRQNKWIVWYCLETLGFGVLLGQALDWWVGGTVMICGWIGRLYAAREVRKSK